MKLKKNTPKYLNYYYMAAAEVDAKSIADTCISHLPQYSEQVEYWNAAGVIEISLGEKSSIDIEKLPLFEDETDQKFLKQHNIQTIFSIQILDSDLELLKQIFTVITDELGGFVCSDTENFQPYLILSKTVK